MRTASIGPHVGEGDLFTGTLLEKQTVLRIEQEDTEGSMQETLVDIFHKMT